MWSNKRCHDTTRPLTPCTSQPSLEKEKAAKQTCSLSQWHCARPQHASSRSTLVPRAARRNCMRRTSLSKIHLDLLERSFQGGEPAAVGPNLDPRDPRLRAVVQARARGRCRKKPRGLKNTYFSPHVVGRIFSRIFWLKENVSGIYKTWIRQIVPWKVTKETSPMAPGMNVTENIT